MNNIYSNHILIWKSIPIFVRHKMILTDDITTMLWRIKLQLITDYVFNMKYT